MLIILLVTKYEFPVLFLIFFNTLTYQKQYLSVCGTGFIVCYNMQFIKHFFIDS